MRRDTAKAKFPRAVAVAAAREVVRALEPATHRLVVAGSLRRGKAEVGDVEILYIPRREEQIATPEGELFPRRTTVDRAADCLDALVHLGVLALRTNVLGRQMCGPRNKYYLHVESGVPVDCFATDQESWHNYLVCRTGPAAMNATIAARAIERGYKWAPYTKGFVSLRGREVVAMHSEAEVFLFVGLAPVAPEERG